MLRARSATKTEISLKQRWGWMGRLKPAGTAVCQICIENLYIEISPKRGMMDGLKLSGTAVCQICNQTQLSLETEVGGPGAQSSPARRGCSSALAPRAGGTGGPAVPPTAQHGHSPPGRGGDYRLAPLCKYCLPLL